MASKKKAKKKAKPLVATQLAKPKTRSDLKVRRKDLRRMAGHEYITDRLERSVEALYEDPERPYKSAVAISTFKTWSIEDSWKTRRDAYFLEIERRVLSKHQDKLVEQMSKELEQLQEQRDLMFQYLSPMRDPDTGEVLMHEPTVTYTEVNQEGDVVQRTYPNPLYGMPKLALEMPRYDQMVSSFLKLEQHIMTRRGQPTLIAEHHHDGSVVHGAAADPTAANLELSDEEIEAMSDVLLQQRQPELVIGVELDDEDDESDE